MNINLLKIDGFDEAIIGVCMTWHGNMLVERIVYDGNKLVSLVIGNSDMKKEEAHDYIDFRIIGAYVGDATPVVMWHATAEEIDVSS